MIKRFYPVMAVLTLLLAQQVHAQNPLLDGTDLDETDITETDWLQLVVGDKENKVGAEVREVKTDEKTGEKTLVIAIPKISMDDPGAMEEIVVVGQAPEESGPLFDIKYETEWLDRYDEDHYGLLIRVGKDTNWPIRLFMHSDKGPRESQRDLSGQ